MKSFSLKNNDRTLNTLGFTSNAMPFLKPKLYPQNTKITFMFLYLWQKFLVPIKDLFNGSKFWNLHTLIHIIAIRMRYKDMLMTINFDQVTMEDCFTVFLNWTLTMMKLCNSTSHTEISPSKRRSKQVTCRRAVNSPMSSNIENW